MPDAILNLLPLCCLPTAVLLARDGDDRARPDLAAALTLAPCAGGVSLLMLAPGLLGVPLTAAGTSLLLTVL